jgi:putative transposase
MPRLPRYFAPGLPLHIIVRGNNRDPVFRSNQDAGTYRAYLREVAEANGLAVHAYVLMTNHVHVLATPATAASAPRTMQVVDGRYAKYFNFIYERTGTIWEGRYRATAVDSDRYLLACMRYIELNPVRAGMVKSPGGHRWSSHAANALGAVDPLVTPHALYVGLGSTAAARRSAYRALFERDPAEEELAVIRDSTHYGWALGAPGFADAIRAQCRRRASRQALGRPTRK